ncbi:hypothetical protein EDB83DRAFT_2426012 [Lactarius deliciosus]|nr:hypothetical protein EDB83DRAFT_2426012 [Lactarius deliciosus]
MKAPLHLASPPSHSSRFCTGGPRIPLQRWTKASFFSASLVLVSSLFLVSLLDCHPYCPDSGYHGNVPNNRASGLLPDLSFHRFARSASSHLSFQSVMASPISPHSLFLANPSWLSLATLETPLEAALVMHLSPDLEEGTNVVRHRPLIFHCF